MPLQNNQQLWAKITRYGTGLAKATGKAYFYIDFDCDGMPVRWMGSPLKNNGEVNSGFPPQLAAAGFDATRNKLADVATGMGSNVLNETGTVLVRVVQKPNGSGEMEWTIAWIGESKTASREDTAAALPPDIDEKLAAIFPKAARNDIPF